MGRGGGGGCELSLDSIDSLSQIKHSSSSSAVDIPVGFKNFITMAAGPPSPRNKVNEMNFFLEEKNNGQNQDTSLKIQTRLCIKKEDLVLNTGLRLHNHNTGSDESTLDDGVSANEEDKEKKNELLVMQSEFGRLNEENQRLKEMLGQVTHKYNALHMHFFNLLQQRDQKDNDVRTTILDRSNQMRGKPDGQLMGAGTRQFMDLGPAATAEMEEQSNSSTEERGPLRSETSPVNNGELRFDQDRLRIGNEKIVLVREDNSDDDPQLWMPNKLAKLMPTRNAAINTAAAAVVADQTQDATMRKARVSVRARSEAPMITDGCQWRKYGQKMAKGNPCPRAYYRCTMAAGCPVRKQVQRCAEDRTILITTYEGTHNHPLPPAAMTMVNTTSAAANMLLSGSMSSPEGLMNNYMARTLLPCSTSMATISASAPFPTVTLDLTNTPNPLQLQRPPIQFPLPFPNGSPMTFPSPLPATAAAPLSQIFGQALFNQSKFSGLQLSNSPDVQPKPEPHPAGQTQASSIADTVSAATAAITSDPNFTAAIAAAITSIIGAGGGSNAGPGNQQISNSTTTSKNNDSGSTNGSKHGNSDFPTS